jgi:hypothetical protein
MLLEQEKGWGRFESMSFQWERGIWEVLLEASSPAPMTLVYIPGHTVIMSHHCDLKTAAAERYCLGQDGIWLYGCISEAVQ